MRKNWTENDETRADWSRNQWWTSIGSRITVDVDNSNDETNKFENDLNTGQIRELNRRNIVAIVKKMKQTRRIKNWNDFLTKKMRQQAQRISNEAENDRINISIEWRGIDDPSTKKQKFNDLNKRNFSSVRLVFLTISMIKTNKSLERVFSISVFIRWFPTIVSVSSSVVLLWFFPEEKRKSERDAPLVSSREENSIYFRKTKTIRSNEGLRLRSVNF